MRRLVEEFPASERRVCELMKILRMSYRYRSRRDDKDLRERLLALAREKPRFGYRRLHVCCGAIEAVKTNASTTSGCGVCITILA